MKEIYNLFIQTQTSEIENAYNKLLLYGQEVADFLLYVTGSHSNHEEHWVENSRRIVIQLRDKRSEALILGSLLFQYNASEYVFLMAKFIDNLIFMLSIWIYPEILLVGLMLLTLI